MQYTGAKFSKAFTMIELLIVITILALLTSLAATSYLAAQVRSRDSARKSTVNTISSTIETYYSVHQKFPGDPYIATNTSGKTLPNSLSTVVGKCEQATPDIGTNPPAPYYYYFPGQNCSTGPKVVSAGFFDFDPDEYRPEGTWIPGLGSYLSPYPAESKYLGFNGTVFQTPTDVLDNDQKRTMGPGLQINDHSRTLIYRNLNSTYLVYARLESDNDRDFKTQFSDSLPPPGSICLPQVPAIPLYLSCVPYPNAANPIVLYLIQK